MRKTNVWTLFSMLVMAAMFFNRSNYPTSVLCRIPQDTFIPSLVPIGQVVSEEKIFERNNIENSKKTSKKGNKSNIADQVMKMKIWPEMDLIMLYTFIPINHTLGNNSFWKCRQRFIDVTASSSPAEGTTNLTILTSLGIFQTLL